jgi:PAS domain S-box-containing protein
VARANESGEFAICDADEGIRFVANAIPSLMAYVDADVRYVWANEAYRRWFGCAPDTIRGVHAREVLGSAAWARLAPYVQRALAGEEVTFEDRVVYKSGPVRYVRASYIPHLDAAGRVCGFAVTANDITQIREAELERERAEQELREVARRKDEFLAMLSHELRNPLAPILNAVEILDRAPPEDHALASRYHEVIARQVRHVKRLLDDLLDVSRVRQGKIQLQKQPVELEAILLQAVEMSRPLIVEKRQRLSLGLEGSRLPLLADGTRLVQVFANLLNNAAKYTDTGGHITLGVACEAGEAVVSVRDDGIGMSPDLLARAFDLFVQDTRSIDRAQGGLGIGLTLARTLVTMHGGSVRAFSSGPGHGSELVVRLPLAAAAEALAEAPAPREGPVPCESSAGPALRVLVVDDNEDVAQALQDLLTLLGHEVTLARDGPAALAAAADVRPDLVLLDIGLPGMDGYTVAEQLREIGQDQAELVALTGYGREEDLRRARSAGFDRHIVKPVDAAALCGLIAEVSVRASTAERRGSPQDRPR